MGESTVGTGVQGTATSGIGSRGAAITGYGAYVTTTSDTPRVYAAATTSGYPLRTSGYPPAKDDSRLRTAPGRSAGPAGGRGYGPCALWPLPIASCARIIPSVEQDPTALTRARSERDVAKARYLQAEQAAVARLPLDQAAAWTFMDDGESSTDQDASGTEDEAEFTAVGAAWEALEADPEFTEARDLYNAADTALAELEGHPRPSVYEGPGCETVVVVVPGVLVLGLILGVAVAMIVTPVIGFVCVTFGIFAGIVSWLLLWQLFADLHPRFSEGSGESVKWFTVVVGPFLVETATVVATAINIQRALS